MSACNGIRALSELAHANFFEVSERFRAENMGVSAAYRLAFKKPWRFYAEHTPDEAIALLKEEAGE